MCSPATDLYSCVLYSTTLHVMDSKVAVICGLSHDFQVYYWKRILCSYLVLDMIVHAYLHVMASVDPSVSHTSNPN